MWPIEGGQGNAGYAVPQRSRQLGFCLKVIQERGGGNGLQNRRRHRAVLTGCDGIFIKSTPYAVFVEVERSALDADTTTELVLDLMVVLSWCLKVSIFI